MFYQFKREDALRFVESTGIPYKIKGSELTLRRCPYCGKTNSTDKEKFAINLETGQFNCLRASCGAHGNMITLSRDFDFSLGEQYDAYYKPQKKRFRTFAKRKEPIVPKPKAIEFLESRGISAETAKRYQVTIADSKGDDVLAFTFFDEDGKPTFVKYRKTDFVKGRDHCKEWSEANCKPILYGMELCNPENPQLVLTEGMMDSLSVAEAGIENAISVPNGAKGFTWLPYCWDWIHQFESIVIFGDYEKGSITLLDELKDRLNLTILHVREDAYKDCKDANELLVKYGKDAVRNAVETAVTLPVRRVIEMADVKSIDIYKVEKLPTGINSLDKMLYGGLPFGGVTVVTGVRGEGKSIFGSQLIVQALKGGFTCMLYSGELTNSSVKSWIHFQIAGSRHISEDTNIWGDSVYTISNTNNNMISEWYRGRFLVYDSESDEIEDEDESLAKTVREVVMRNGARVIVIDNLMTALDLEPVKGDDKYDRQSKFVKRLARIARKHDVLIILIAHKRKAGIMGEVDDNDAVSGSADITNLATCTLVYCKDRNLEDSQRLLKLTKNRLFGKTCRDGWVMEYDPKSRRIYGQGDDPNFEVGWDNESDGDGFSSLLNNLGEGAEELMAWESE